MNGGDAGGCKAENEPASFVEKVETDACFHDGAAKFVSIPAA